MVYINRWVYDVMDGHDYGAGLRVTGSKLRYFSFTLVGFAHYSVYYPPNARRL